jgi:hypothetical protein
MIEEELRSQELQELQNVEEFSLLRRTKFPYSGTPVTPVTPDS